MEDVKRRFSILLERTLIPDFCSNIARNMSPSAFRPSNLECLSDIDLADFLRGWEAQLFQHVGNGLYRAPQGGAFEQFFWSGGKENEPRTFSLRIEPIITLGVLARMHLDFCWPKTLIGTQSKPYFDFDVFAYKADNERTLSIACEVKKSRKEADALSRYMQSFGREPDNSAKKLQPEKKNALLKLKALREQKPSIFWVVGPERYDNASAVRYRENGVVEFEAISTQALHHDAPAREHPATVPSAQSSARPIGRDDLFVS